MTARLLAISLNTRIHDKPPVWQEEYADNWQSGEAGVSGLRDAICRGHAFIPAAMRDSHRSSAAFLHADLAVVDIDHGLDLGGFRAHPLASHACLIYTSSSHRPEPGHHRFRVLFRLPERVSDPELYKAIVTALIRALGGDKSCNDPCRIFYGNSRCEHWLNATDACLPASFIEEARREWLRNKARYEERSNECDPASIERAIHVLANVLPPTTDGERHHFIRITAAAAAGGDLLFPAWCDWATRGHHGSGKNRKQASERFFRGFSGRSSLGTLFFLASEHDPDWRDSLPDEVRTSDGGARRLPGYSHEDFLGHDDPAYGAPKPGALKTQSMLDLVAQTSPAASDPETAADPEHDLPPEPLLQAPAQDPDETDPEFLGQPDEPLLLSSGQPKTPEPSKPAQKTGKGSRSSKGQGTDDVTLIEGKVKARYPGLRFNRLNLSIESGPRDRPALVEDADRAYLHISRGEDRVFSKQQVQDVIQLIAHENSYNPVLDFLDDCKDEEPIDYFDSLASTLLGLPEEGPDNPRLPDGRLLADVALSRFLIAAVARARNPGCALGWMPILVGPQNVGKTNFFQYLTPKDPVSKAHTWCPTIQQGISYLKERPHVLHAGWIVNLDEVDRFFRRRYTEEFKNLVTVSVDRSRRLYENERSFPRAFVLAGCTNNNTFLVDPTGNRRFMVITVLGKVPSKEDPEARIIDLDRVKQDHRRIWATAQRAYADDIPYEFSSSETSYAEDYLDGFRVDTPLSGALRDVLSRNISFLYKGRPAYVMNDIFRWLDLPLDPGNSSNIGLTDELRKLGYESKRRRISSGPAIRFWQLTKPSAQSDGPGLLMDWQDDRSRRY